MCKIPVIFEIKLAVEKAKHKIGIREESHGQACNRPPIPDLLIIYSLCNNRARNGMSNAIHQLMLTCYYLSQQLGMV